MSWTKTAAYDENAEHYRNHYIETLRFLLKDAKGYNTYQEGDNVTAFQPLVAELESALAEAKELLNHEHKWTSLEESGPSYCTICGMPGDI